MKTEEELLNLLSNIQKRITKEGSSDKVIHIARSYWTSFKLQAKSYNRNLKVPLVLNEDLLIYYIWCTKDDVSLQVDITEKNSYYYFSDDKRGLMWEKHYEPLQPPYGIPTDIYNKVLLFTEEAQ